MDERDVDTQLAALALAELNALADAEVPDIVSGVFTTDDWRDMLLITWFVWWRPDLLTDAARDNYRKLHGRFRLALTPELVADLERRAKAGESFTWAEGQLWFAAVEASKAQLPQLESVVWNEGEPEPPEPASHRAWDEWYETPIAVSLFAGRPAPRQLPRRHARPRGRRVARRTRLARRTRARAPAGRSGDDDPHDHELDRPGATVALARSKTRAGRRTSRGRVA